MSTQIIDTRQIRFPGPGKRRWFRRPRRGTGATVADWRIADEQRIADIRWQWRQACEITGLGRLIFTPSGPTVSIPMLGRVVRLGPPVTFIVRPLPGQLLEDFEAARPRIAAALGVADIRFAPLAGDWLVAELITAPARGRALDAPTVVPFPRRNAPDLEADWDYAA